MDNSTTYIANVLAAMPVSVIAAGGFALLVSIVAFVLTEDL